MPGAEQPELAVCTSSAYRLSPVPSGLGPLPGEMERQNGSRHQAPAHLRVTPPGSSRSALYAGIWHGTPDPSQAVVAGTGGGRKRRLDTRAIPVPARCLRAPKAQSHVLPEGQSTPPSTD